MRRLTRIGPPARDRASLPRARRIRALDFARARNCSRGSRGSLGSLGAAKFRARRTGPGFVCVLMRSNFGPTANIAYTTVRSIFGTVADGDVICSSPRRLPTQVLPATSLGRYTHCSFRGRRPVPLRYRRPSLIPIGFPGGERKAAEIDPFPSTSGTESSKSISLHHPVRQSWYLPENRGKSVWSLDFVSDAFSDAFGVFSSHNAQTEVRNW
jgi:hypothetical protein